MKNIKYTNSTSNHEGFYDDYRITNRHQTMKVS